jgi:hypothetical protein
MTSFPRSPHILKAGIVVLDASAINAAQVVVLQYNPDQLSRTLQVQATSGEAADRSEALRLKGPPVETFKIEAELDATDQLETARPTDTVVIYGIFPQLAVLESLITPPSDQVSLNDRLLREGVVEIAPMEAPLALFVWSKHRVVPVRITEFSITEEAFDTELNPIRAKVSLSMRGLSVNDFGFGHPGGRLFMSYLKNKEDQAKLAVRGALQRLGHEHLP